MHDFNIAEFIQSARLEHYQTILVEAMGLFWILAECWILFWIRVGRKALQHHGMEPADFGLRRLFLFNAFFVAFAAAVIGRHLIGHSYPSSLAAALAGGNEASLSEALQRHIASQRLHYALWSAFVTIWIVLETAIVYNGLRGYRQLRALLPATNSSASQRSGAMLALIGFAASASVLSAAAAWPAEPDAGNLVRMLNEARDANAAYRNAMLLYLRIAGVAWIAVEWIAAIILWKSYRMLARAIRKENIGKCIP